MKMGLRVKMGLKDDGIKGRKGVKDEDGVKG